ncbi:MAG: polysaccharide ABC transporter ATP-binding protein [Desulfatibacillaceae bacterium]
MDKAIIAENLSKRYQLGIRVSYRTIGQSVINAVKAPFTRTMVKEDSEGEVQSLDNVSFTVDRGETLGVIGRNGAGKSTLLKILSRITEPTSGRAVIRGRVGALLEVGTGFHPELTGHENIYLYGAIMGMSRWEVTRKFDDIVAFAEFSRFIETPVKFYSSGMYMRLAFAVAAHLETEVLLVDEVLAVGDSAFQKKCLGKMNQVTSEGRTVLFVSHNMHAVQSICDRVILLESGKILHEGHPRYMVERYMEAMGSLGTRAEWGEEDAPGNDTFRLLSVSVATESGDDSAVLSSAEAVQVTLRFWTRDAKVNARVGFDLSTAAGEVVFRTYHTDMPEGRAPALRKGCNEWRCTIPAGTFNQGVYHLLPRISEGGVSWIVNREAVAAFQVKLDHEVARVWHSVDRARRAGVIAPALHWEDVG